MCYNMSEICQQRIARETLRMCQKKPTVNGHIHCIECSKKALKTQSVPDDQSHQLMKHMSIKSIELVWCSEIVE